MKEYTLKLSGDRIVGYMDSSYSVDDLTSYLMKVDILPLGGTDEVWFHLVNKSQELFQFVFTIGIEEDEEFMRCFPAIDVDRSITIKSDGIYQSGNKIMPLKNPDYRNFKQRMTYYHNLVRGMEDRLRDSNHGFGDGWENGEVYEVHAVSEIPQYYKGNRLHEDMMGYFKDFEIKVDEYCIEFELVDEDVNLYAVDAIYPSQFSYLVLSSLEGVDLDKQVFISKDGVYQDGTCLSGDAILSDKQYIDMVSAFQKRLIEYRNK
jgi:hypothetical protein